MTTPPLAYTANHLSRWSCVDKALPGTEQIKHLHVYDFDNTLFASPLPSRQLWQGSVIGMLQSQHTLVDGGWWHDQRVLASTGAGLAEEEPKAWQGWWNEQIVDLVRLTMEQKDALNVLLTGRSEAGFAELVRRMVKSKGLDFDMICLKQEVGPTGQTFASTMNYKQTFLHDLIHTYSAADEIRIYEDRPKHIDAFREFLSKLNAGLVSSSRKPISAEVIEVSEKATNLDPVVEVAEVQRMINATNTAIRAGTASASAKPLEIKRSVIFTGYLITPTDTDRILTACGVPTTDPDVRILANNIMITPGPCPPHILQKVGGIGKRMSWRATHTGVYEGRIWAWRVEPVITGATYHCENLPPYVLLALRQGARPIEALRIKNWHGLSRDRVFEFETTVGEKVVLRIEQEQQQPMLHRANGFPKSREAKRFKQNENEFPPLGTQPPTGPQSQQRHSQQDGTRRQNATSGPHRNDRGRGSGGRGGGRNVRGGSHGRGGSGGGGGGGGRGRGRAGYVGHRDYDYTSRRGGSGGHGIDGARDDGVGDRGLTY